MPAHVCRLGVRCPLLIHVFLTNWSHTAKRGLFYKHMPVITKRCTDHSQICQLNTLQGGNRKQIVILVHGYCT